MTQAELNAWVAQNQSVSMVPTQQTPLTYADLPNLVNIPNNTITDPSTGAPLDPVTGRNLDTGVAPASQGAPDWGITGGGWNSPTTSPQNLWNGQIGWNGQPLPTAANATQALNNGTLSAADIKSNAAGAASATTDKLISFAKSSGIVIFGALLIIVALVIPAHNH